MAEQDREGKADGGRLDSNPHGEILPDAPIETEILISWTAEEAPGRISKVSFLTVARLTWDEVFTHLPLTENVSRNRLTLLKMFANSVATHFRPMIERRGAGKVTNIRGKLDLEVIEQILRTLERAGYVIPTHPPPYVKQRGNYWRLTDKGAQRMAAIKEKLR